MSIRDNEILSEGEIQALIQATENEHQAYNIDVDAKAYNIANEVSTAGARLSALNMMNARFARQFRVSLESMLHYTPNIDAEVVVVEPFLKFMESLKAPLSFNLVALSPLRGPALFIIDTPLIYSALDGFFSGIGLAPEERFGDSVRDFTPTESRIIEMLLERVFKDLKDAWTPTYELDFQFIKTEVNPQFAHILEDNELVVVSRFSVAMAGGVKGSLQIIYPYASLKAIRNLLDTRVIGDTSSVDENFWQQYLNKAIDNVELPLKSELACVSVNLYEVMNYEVGDVIPVQISEYVTVTAEGQPILKGVYGSRNGNAAIKIMHKIVLTD